MSIHIKSWAPEFTTDVYYVLKEASYSNLWNGYISILGKTWVITGVLSASMYIFIYSGSLLYCVATILSMCITVYLTLMIGTWYYLYGPPLADMNDVKKNYLDEPDNHFWIAERREEIVGTISITKKQEASQDKVAFLRRMAVLEDMRRCGVGRRLLEHALTFCKERNYTRIDLITTDVHQAARELYEKMGFKQVGYRPYKYLFGLVNIWTYEYTYHFYPKEVPVYELKRKLKDY